MFGSNLVEIGVFIKHSFELGVTDQRAENSFVSTLYVIVDPYGLNFWNRDYIQLICLRINWIPADYSSTIYIYICIPADDLKQITGWQWNVWLKLKQWNNL